ncbi:hypothetical protein Aple_010900 [Acrocarpospora pleiomorpha]|uniref:Uncharacterized protein n=1 Tax=Acrocarpospora pleiomorpha TaxID=90975 RepID=A0A5M3X8Z9_9ACTN|nr:hypothetical protein Aple_010900 [Acrocarpospora pleiomorpha]
MRVRDDATAAREQLAAAHADQVAALRERITAADQAATDLRQRAERAEVLAESERAERLALAQPAEEAEPPQSD